MGWCRCPCCGLAYLLSPDLDVGIEKVCDKCALHWSLSASGRKCPLHEWFGADRVIRFTPEEVENYWREQEEQRKDPRKTKTRTSNYMPYNSRASAEAAFSQLLQK